MRKSLSSSVALAAIIAFFAAQPAVAKSPPEGKYGCSIGGIYFGELKITSSDIYRRYGKKGKYKAGGAKIHFDDGVTGYTIRFKTGPLKDFKGRWYRAGSGTAEIALKNPEDGFESIYCDEE